jgi:stress-induced morphogen
VTIRDLAGDGDHYAAEVVAESFRGKSPRAAAPDGL